MSEYEPGVEPAPWRFPARNRIIAGLCAATVVVEARERSGALITADFALEEGREVFAVPGEITSALSAGSNALLRLGAMPLTCAADVLELYDIAPRRQVQARLGPLAEALLAQLSGSALTVDEFVRATALDPGASAAALMELELAGRVTFEDGVYRARSRIASDVDDLVLARGALRAAGRGSIEGAADVAIVGGGITGCSCALALAEAGLRVRLFETREIAGGASGRNGGFALRGGAAPYPVLAESIGSEATAGSCGSGRRSELEQLAGVAGDAFRATGSLRLAADDEERDELRDEYEALRDAGFAAEWRENPGAPIDRYPAALFHPPDGVLQPARLVRRIAARAATAGVEIHGHHRRRLAGRDGRGHRRRRDQRVPEWPARRDRGAHRPDARPGDRNRADR